MLCVDLNGKEIQGREVICISIVDSLWYIADIAETNNTVKQLHSNKKFKRKKHTEPSLGPLTQLSCGNTL